MSITGINSCPECKLPITIRAINSNVVICSHCYAPIKKMEGYLQARINLLVAKDESSPIQLGTTGEWDGKKFEIIGRARYVFVEGTANFWTMLFDGGEILLLAENCGQLAVYEKVKLQVNVSFNRVRRMDYGSETTELNTNKYYILERQRFSQYAGVEGEAFLFDGEGQVTFLELAAQGGGRIALIAETQKEAYVSYNIKYKPFSAFGFEHLRNLQPGTVIKEIPCKSCNASNVLYSWPMAQSFACTTCGACYTLEKDEWKYKRRVKLSKNPVIPLHVRGAIRGTEYQVVGYMEKMDEDAYEWREYTLYNPFQGYAYLSEYNGHWIFLKEMADAPVVTSNKTMAYRYEGKTFRKYNQYKYKLVDGRGEFPGAIYADNLKKPDCIEYIAPPEIWVRENHEWADGLCYYHGTHIKASELYDAFGQISLPYSIGVGSVQPALGQVDTTVLRNSCLGIIAFFLLSFLVSTLFNHEKVLYENIITLPDSTSLPPVVTPQFRLDKWRSNLEFYISAPVSNNWFEAGITLVNVDNGTEYTVEKGVEKYSGYDDGESWSEGSDHDEVMLNKIPAGNYFLQVFPSRGDLTVQSFLLRVTYDVPMWRNFFVFALFALLPVGVLYVRIYMREGMRWQNSPFHHTS